MDHFSRKEIIALLLLLFAVFISTTLNRYSRLYNKSAVSITGSFEVFIEKATNVAGLAEILNKSDIQFDPAELSWAANTLGWRRYQPGRYLITYGVSYSDLLSKLGRGIQDPAPVTVLPGIDLDRLSSQLSNQLRADSLSFRKLFKDSSKLAHDLDVNGEQLFARMLPETYQMYWTTSAENVVKRIHSEFQKAVIETYKNEIERHDLSLDEIMILASIVEWEARHNEEKPKISGLYLNRLERNMRLQADPTVLYALGERRRLLYEDYEYDHPYNTYRINGLPPGPITNPDIHSIRAVLFPEDHDFLYMVATPEGRHRFSESYREHQEASQEWRRWLREQYRIQRERQEEESKSSSDT